MNAIIISDLHIGSQYLKFRILEDFLKAIPNDHEFIMNGDIIDRPYSKMQPSDQRILDLIEQISMRQKVVWIRLHTHWTWKGKGDAFVQHWKKTSNYPWGRF